MNWKKRVLHNDLEILHNDLNTNKHDMTVLDCRDISDVTCDRVSTFQRAAAQAIADDIAKAITWAMENVRQIYL